VIKLPSGRQIGPGHEPFIIAEVGSNWRKLDDCKNSIVQAKACGADTVKFQAYDRNALYGIDTFPELSTETSAKLHGQLPLEWLPILEQKAKAVGIEFMCSAFSPELIDAVDPFVSIHKVASAECTHKRMLERLALIGKPVILSTGAHGVEDVRAALSVLGDTPTVLLYCVAAYPARMVNLATIKAMAETLGLPVGYSDHSTDALTIPAIATDLGACVLEKHVTFIDAATPDSPHSLTADEFKAMVSFIRNGSLPVEMSPVSAERPMVLRHNRRLIATRDIPEGYTLLEGDNFGIYRSLKDETHAFHPFMIDEVNGKLAKRAIKAGDGIGPGDI
jgi:sialic acid synthase SpsE